MAMAMFTFESVVSPKITFQVGMPTSPPLPPSPSLCVYLYVCESGYTLIDIPELQFRKEKMTTTSEIRWSNWISIWKAMVLARTETRKGSSGLPETCLSSGENGKRQSEPCIGCCLEATWDGNSTVSVRVCVSEMLWGGLSRKQGESQRHMETLRQVISYKHTRERG